MATLFHTSRVCLLAGLLLSAAEWQLPREGICQIRLSKISHKTTTDTLEYVLLHPDTVPHEYLKNAATELRRRIIADPGILSTIHTRIIVDHSHIFDQKLLDGLTLILKNDHKRQSAANAIVILAAHSETSRLTAGIVIAIGTALDDASTAWWAADIASRLAKKRVDIINPAIVNRLFRLMEEENSWIVASAAISDIGLNTQRGDVQNAVLKKTFRALNRPRTSRQAAYILSNISRTQPHLIPDEVVEDLFALLRNDASTSYDHVEVDAMAYLRDKNASLFAADALASIGTRTRNERLSASIFSQANRSLDQQRYSRLASYLMVKLIRDNHRLMTFGDLERILSLLDNRGVALFATDVLAAVVESTDAKEMATMIYKRAIDELEGEGPPPKGTVRIIAAVGKRWTDLIDRETVDRLLVLLREVNRDRHVSTALTQIVLKANDRSLGRRIVKEMLHQLDRQDPDMEKARKITRIARNRPRVLTPHLEQLIDLLHTPAIRKEISLSLYFMLLSDDETIRNCLAAYLRKQLTSERMDGRLKESLLYFAQILSFELDRLHQIDGSNRVMVKRFQIIPDPLLYMVLAQGVEGYVTTFKEVHWEYKRRKFNTTYLPGDQKDNDRLWREFRKEDPGAHFLGDLLYAYAAKGHLPYIIPKEKRQMENMVDISTNMIERARGVGQTKQRGVMMADVITLFLRHSKTKSYAKSRLLKAYRDSRKDVPKKVMFESLIFRNKETLGKMLDEMEQKKILLSGHYVDYTTIPAGLNGKRQKLFLYFSPSQKGYLTRMIDYYMGNKGLFVGNDTKPHPHIESINGFDIDRVRSTPGVRDGASADKVLGERVTVKVVLRKETAAGIIISLVLSNHLDELEDALEDDSYTAFGFAGHSGENWIFRKMLGERLENQDRPVWIYDGSCGSARRVTHLVKNANLFLFGNLETGKGPVNQIQIYYIAHYLAEGRFKRWQRLKNQMMNQHTGYTSKLFYPGSPADNVLKNFMRNMKREGG